MVKRSFSSKRSFNGHWCHESHSHYDHKDPTGITWLYVTDPVTCLNSMATMDLGEVTGSVTCPQLDFRQVTVSLTYNFLLHMIHSVIYPKYMVSTDFGQLTGSFMHDVAKTHII